MTWGRAAGAVAIALAAAGGVLAAQGQMPSFSARADLVAVDVAVQRGGRPVMGLTAGDFQIFDNGVAQTVADLSYGKLPIDVTIALDVSGSVTGDAIDQLRAAIEQLTKDLTPQDRLKIITFNMRVNRLVNFTSGTDDPSSAFAHIRTFGSTAIFDTLAVALTAESAPDRRQLIVVFSDGRDSASVISPGTLLDVAKHTTPTVAVVLASLGSGGAAVAAHPQAESDQARLRPFFDELTRDTGGVVATAGPKTDLTKTFHEVLDQFRSSYVLHFSPRGVATSGVHALDVRVERGGVDVRFRKSYAWR